MEEKTLAYIAGIIGSIAGLIIAIAGWFITRMVRGYDDQIKELFRKNDDLRDDLAERTADIPAVKTDIEWIKSEVKK